MGLSNYQLVLLDNLIYVKSIKKRLNEKKEEFEKNNAEQEVTFEEDKAGKGVTIDSIISDLMKDLEDAEQEEKEKNPEKSEILLTCEMSK